MAQKGFDFSRAGVAVVTGAGSGIGRALCLSLARHGVRAVVAADLDLAGAEETAKQISHLALGGSARPVRCDASSPEDIDRLITDTEKQEGPVDAFFANAGIGGDAGGVDAASLELWHKMMAINVYQAVHAARRLLPDLAKRGGCFAVTSSAAGLMTQLGSIAYTTTKHAARALTEWLAITYGDAGLHVACLCPQAVESKMTAGSTGGPAGLDGIITAEAASECLLKTLEEGKFLALPHPQVDTYVKRKAGDVDRWLQGMRKQQAKLIQQGLAPDPALASKL